MFHFQQNKGIIVMVGVDQHLSFVYLCLLMAQHHPTCHSGLLSSEQTAVHAVARTDRVRKDLGHKICGVTGAAGQRQKREPKLNERAVEGGSDRRREHVALPPWAQCDLSESHCGERHRLSSFTTALRQASPDHLGVTHRSPTPQ